MKHKVLIVDDSQTIRKIIRSNLEKLGVKDIYEAADGESAVKTASSNSDISIIIMDYNMPILNGLGALKQIRANNYCEAKVVALSSAFTQSILDSYRELGISGVLTKPFDLDKFNDVVAPIMSGMTPSIERPNLQGIAKDDVIRLFRDENPSIKLDGLFVEFEFTREKIKLDVDTIARNGSLYSEL